MNFRNVLPVRRGQNIGPAGGLISVVLANIFLTVSVGLNAAEGVDAEPEMVVTATRVERQVFETPHAVSILDDQAVAESNAAKTPDLLMGATGVLIQKTNAGGGAPYIRGLIGKQVLIMVDGVRLNNSFYRFGPHQYLNTIDPNIIERIEVVRGPGSVLYGSDALGGVINVITKRRTNFARSTAFEGLLQLHAQTADSQFGGRAQVEGNWGPLGLVAGVGGKRFDDVRGGGGLGTQIPTGYDEGALDLKLNYKWNDSNELIFAHQFSRQFDVPKTNEVTLGNKLKFNYEPQLRALDYVEYRAKDVGFFEALRFNISYNRQQEGEEVVARAAPTVETREITDVRTKGVVAELTSLVGKTQRLTYGFDYYHDDYATRNARFNLFAGASTSIAPGTPNGADYESTGIFLQDEISFTPRFDAILGARYSRFEADGKLLNNQLSFSGSKLTASANALYRLNPHWNLVGGVAQGYRAPNMEDFFGRVDFVSEIPNTQLQPEKSINREIGLKYYSEHTSADIFLYEADYDDLIVRTTVSPGVRQRQNIKKATIRGVETGIKHVFNKHWSAAANLTYTRGEDQDSGRPLQRIPPLNGQLRVRYERSANDWYELSSLFARKQTRLSPEDITDARIPPGGTPGYATLNFKAGFKPIRDQEWLVSLENIGDIKYKSHGSGVYAPGINLAVIWRLSLN